VYHYQILYLYIFLIIGIWFILLLECQGPQGFSPRVWKNNSSLKKKKKKLALKELIKENEQRPLPASLLQDFNSVLY